MVARANISIAILSGSSSVFLANSQSENPRPVLLDAWLCTNATTKAEMNKNNKYLPLLLIRLARKCNLEKERLQRRKKYCQIKKFSV